MTTPPARNDASGFGDVTAWFGRLERALYGFLERWLKGGTWLLLALLVILVVSTFISGPRFDVFARGVRGAYLIKQENPMADVTRIETHLAGHDAKHNFRLTVPVVSYALGLKGRTVPSYFVALSLLGMLAGLLWLVRRETDDAVTAFLFTFFVSLTYAGSFAVVKISYDYVAIFLILMAFVRRPFWLPGVLVFLALWCDERAFLASLVPLAYHAYRYYEGADAADGKLAWPRFPPAVCTILGVYAVSFGLRSWLKVSYGLHLPMSYGEALGMIYENRNRYHLGLAYAWEGGWLIALLCWFRLCLRRQWLLLGGAFALGMFLLMSSMTVHDLSRGLHYAFPAVLWYFLMLARMGMPQLGLRRLALFALLVSLAMSSYTIHPSGYYGRTERVEWVQPMPQTIYQFFIRDGGEVPQQYLD